MLIKPHITISFLLLISITSNLNRKSFSYLQPHKTYIESHRGVNRELPENTLSAFKRAIEFDVDSIELDIWLTSDNIPVVIHGGNNGDVSLTTNGHGSVKKYTFSELRELHTLIGNEKIPSLEEVLNLCKDKIFINIEIKDDRYDLVFDTAIKLIEKYDMNEQIQFSSFHHKYYDKVQEYNKNHDKKIEFGFIYNDKSKKFDYKSNSTINIHHKKVNENVVNKAHSLGIGVMTWFYMGFQEDTREYERLINLGVDIICSNDPLLAKKFRDNYYK